MIGVFDALLLILIVVLVGVLNPGVHTTFSMRGFLTTDLQFNHRKAFYLFAVVRLSS